MSAKDEALKLIRDGYYGGELSIEELMPELESAIRKIKEAGE